MFHVSSSHCLFVRQTGELLDRMADDFRASEPSLEKMTTRQKALALNRWLRCNGFQGLQDPTRAYRNLRNSLLVSCLQSESHQAIPIIAASIYSAVAQRLGLNAHPSCFPAHVTVVVQPKPGHGLDGTKASDEEPKDRLHLDPFSHADDIPLSEFRDRAIHLGFTHGLDQAIPQFLNPSPPLYLVLRNCNNICATVDRASGRRAEAEALGQLSSGDAQLNLEAARYATLWATLVIGEMSTAQRIQHLELFSALMFQRFPEDRAIAEEVFDTSFSHMRWAQNDSSIISNYERLTPHRPLVTRESEEPANRPGSGEDIQIGQVFRHRRLNWIGVVVRLREQRMPYFGTQ